MAKYALRRQINEEPFKIVEATDYQRIGGFIRFTVSVDQPPVYMVREIDVASVELVSD